MNVTNDENVFYPEIPWKLRIIVSTRRQRRTGRTVFRATRVTYGKDVCVDFEEPMHLVQYIIKMQRYGWHVEWQGEQPEGTAAEIVTLQTDTAA